MKYCGEQGCKTLISSGRYCDSHKRKKKHGKASNNKWFYNSGPWRDLKAVCYERDRGCCTKCGKFVFKKTAQHHHVIPIVVRPDLKLKPSNVTTACPKCHAILEQECNEQYNHLGKKKAAVSFDWNL